MGCAGPPSGAGRGYPELAPDLVVEVKSPSNSNPEMAAKAAMWLSYGSRMVWVADPQPVTVTVYRPNAAPVTLHEDDILDGGDVLPGFTTPRLAFVPPSAVAKLPGHPDYRTGATSDDNH